MRDSIREFFEQNKAFDRLLAAMLEMYARYGRSYGAVRLVNPSIEEEAAISAFFDRDYYNQSVMRISLAEFERQLQKEFAQDATLANLLECYFQKPLAPKKQKDNTDALTNHITKTLLPEYKNTFAESWLEDVLLNMRRKYKSWMKKCAGNPTETTAMFKTVCIAINNLPRATKMRLSDFSLAFANSHDALGFYGTHGALFLRALAHCFNENIAHTLEESTSLYLRAGLISNGMSSQVMVLGLNAENSNGIPDTACNYYSSIHEPHVLTLENIMKFEHIRPHNETIFIIENPAICAALIDRLRSKLKDKSYTLVCPINGHDAAFMRLLELVQPSAKIYYAGDINYNSLALADKLYLKLTKNFIPWRYGKTDYEKILETNSYMLHDKKKDLSLHNETLASLLSQLRKRGRTASSMPLVPLFAEDIKGGL